MSKQTIKWHEECLKNWEASNKRNAEHLARVLEEFKRDSAKLQFYRDQIAEAKKRGKDGFNRDRFMVRKKEAQ